MIIGVTICLKYLGLILQALSFCRLVTHDKNTTPTNLAINLFARDHRNVGAAYVSWPVNQIGIRI